MRPTKTLRPLARGPRAERVATSGGARRTPAATSGGLTRPPAPKDTKMSRRSEKQRQHTERVRVRQEGRTARTESRTERVEPRQTARVATAVPRWEGIAQVSEDTAGVMEHGIDAYAEIQTARMGGGNGSGYSGPASGDPGYATRPTAQPAAAPPYGGEAPPAAAPSAPLLLGLLALAAKLGGVI